MFTANPYRYRGYYFDAETGLYYLQSRYYDPETGRFLNGDEPIFTIVSGGNAFAYCGNYPVNRVDYFGFCDLVLYPEEYNYGGSVAGTAGDYGSTDGGSMIEPDLKWLWDIVGVFAAGGLTIIEFIESIFSSDTI